MTGADTRPGARVCEKIWANAWPKGLAKAIFRSAQRHGIFLDALGDDPERSVRQGPLQLESLVRRGRHPGLDFIGVVRITGIALGWMAPTSVFGSVVRNANRSLVVSPSLAFRTDVQLVQMPAKQARGRLSSRANQMSPFPR